MSALLRWLVWRRLATERVRSCLALLGVALGVGVFVAIRLANHSALRSFSDTVDAVAGRANLHVASASDGFDERWLARVRDEPGVQAAAPVVQVSAVAKPGGPAAAAAAEFGTPGDYPETLMVLGFDLFAEGPFARLGAGDADARDALDLVARPGTVAITRALAMRHRLALGDSLTVLASGLPRTLHIVRILDREALQQAAGGNVAIVDIATAQEVFGRAGRIDRIDLLVDPARRDGVRDRLRARLPRELLVDLPQGRTRQVENMVGAFSLNLTALSFIALFVSTYLIFNAVALSVLRWRREIGILRGLGVRRGQVVALFLAEGLGFGIAGGVLGLVFGTYLARGALGLVGRTLSDLYLVHHAGRLVFDPLTYGLGFALGVASAVCSALAPALEAAKTPPGVTMRQGLLLEAQRLPIGRLAMGSAGAFALAAGVAGWTVQAHAPLGGFVAAFLVIAGFSLLAPGFTLLLEKAVARPMGWLGGIEGALGARYLREAVARASVVVAALMLAVGMTVALTVMVASFRRTVDTWLTQTIRGDLYVEPVGHRQSQASTALPDTLIDATRRLPGVVAVDTYRGTSFRFRDRLAFAVGIEFAVQSSHGRLAFTRGEPAAAILARARERGEVIVTESFAHRFRVSAGDSLDLPAPSGITRVRVAGAFFDYSTDAGAVLMDRETFARLWQDRRTESLAIYLSRGADPDSARAAFLALAGPSRLFHVTPNQGLRRRALDVFDQTFRITFALQLIAVTVAVLGVITTLTALILQRGREIGVLRAVGATRGQVRAMVLFESGLIGLIGSLLGCLAGFALALLLVFVINKQFFGWSIRLALDPWVFAQAVLVMVATAVAAGLAPARLAAGRLAAEAMRSD